MPRKPRIVVAGQPHHIVIRGINREPIFYHEYDYQYYLQALLQASKENGCSVHAYVLMTNHVHMLVTPMDAVSMGKTVQSVGCRYVQYFNSRYQRTGTLWEGRYRSLLVDSETYLFRCYRYVELNPVRAGMVDHPGGYPWSSYGHNAYGDFNPLISSHPRLHSLGKTSEVRQEAYKSLFDTPVTGEELEQIRELTNREWVLGSEHFKSLIECKLNRRVEPLPRGGDRKSANFRRGQAATNRH
jgi:putative transposase